MAALFNPRFLSQPEPSFRGLFRLLEDFDQYSSQNDGRDDGNSSSGPAQFFTPKFDLKETETTYELHGELPGINKEDVSIEFTDPQTVVIRGKVERSYTRGTPPARAIEANSKPQGALTESGDAGAAHHPDMPHKVTVEDETEGKTTTDTDADADARASTSTDVAKSGAGAEVQKPSAPPAKYWVSERSIGQFSRTFHFPTRVDNDATSADLVNGILTVTVPKAKKLEGKRVTIN